MLVPNPEPEADGESEEKGTVGTLVLVWDMVSLSGSRSFLMSWVTR